MIPYTVFKQDGSIQRSGMCTKECLELQADQGESVLSISGNDARHWVSDGKLVDRPLMVVTASVDTIVADGLSEVQLEGIPIGAIIKVTGPVTMEGVADSTFVELSFAIPGQYIVVISKFPYIDAQVVINAT
jgi:hypothetical protein